MQGGLIGSNAYFKDPSVIVVEMGATTAIEEAFDLTKGVVLVSRRLALMSTTKQA